MTRPKPSEDLPGPADVAVEQVEGERRQPGEPSSPAELVVMVVAPDAPGTAQATLDLQEMTWPTCRSADETDSALAASPHEQNLVDLAPLYDRYGQAIFNLIYRLVGNKSDAEEVLQETFYKACQCRANLSNHPCQGGWLCRVARNFAIGKLRQKNRGSEQSYDAMVEAGLQLPSNALAPTEYAELAERHGELASAIMRLPERQRECIVGSFIKNKTQGEIGRELDISRITVQTHITAGLKNLRKHLKSPAERSLQAGKGRIGGAR